MTNQFKIYLLNVATPATENSKATSYQAGIQAGLLQNPESFEPAMQKIIDVVKEQTDCPLTKWLWSCNPAPKYWAAPLEVLNTQDLIDGKVEFSNQ